MTEKLQIETRGLPESAKRLNSSLAPSVGKLLTGQGQNH